MGGKKNTNLTNISPYQVCFEDDFPLSQRWDIYPSPLEEKQNDSHKSAFFLPFQEAEKAAEPIPEKSWEVEGWGVKSVGKSTIFQTIWKVR